MTLASETASGSVSAQAAAGETVTITITQPDQTTVPLTCQTLADLTFSTPFQPTQTGNHNAHFHVDADASFTSADFDFPFTVTAELSPRTITGQVA